MKTAVFTGILLLCSSLAAQPDSAADSILLPDVAAELQRMHIDDQRYRAGTDSIFDREEWNDSLEQLVWRLQTEIDTYNLKRLDELIEAHGWLGRNKVGRMGALAVFLIIQHAELEAQQRYLPMMRTAVENDDFHPAHLAYLDDRIRMRTGRPQLYGSQMISNPETGDMEVYELEFPAKVDSLRASVGLGPMAEYCERFGIEWTPPIDSTK